MATYAAYRHIELDKVGYGKKRVLKPPGGGSSDIFGTGSAGQDGNIRRVKNHLASSVFLNDDPSTNTATSNSTSSPAVPQKQSGNDSFCRLFGPPSPPKLVNKPRSQSNIIIPDGQQQNSTAAGKQQQNDVNNDQTNGNSEHVNGDTNDGGAHDEPPQIQQPVVNGSTSPVMNGNKTTNGTAAAAGTAPRTRVPPGGYSSGLW